MDSMEDINTIKSSDKSRENKSLPLPLPLPVSRAVTKLGEDINRARRRRSMTQQSLAERIGASVTTIKRMEAGDPRIPLHFLARTLYVFGEIDRLSLLLDSGQDEIGLNLMDEQLPKRIRTSRKSTANAL
jgi:ribosome-binding protein aMBF1 (putative translation factor)